MSSDAEIDAQLPAHLVSSELLRQWVVRALAAEVERDALNAAVSRATGQALKAEMENARLRDALVAIVGWTLDLDAAPNVACDNIHVIATAALAESPSKGEPKA